MTPSVLLILQLAIGAVLLFASLGKWRAPLVFANGVAGYDVLPDWLARVFALVLIPVETWVAASHLTGWWISAALPVGLLMFASFTVAVLINLARGRSLPCYCFGHGSGETISWQALVRLLLLLGGEGLLLFAPGQHGRARPLFDQLTTLQDLGFALFWTAFLIIITMWFLGLADFFELLRSYSPHASKAHQREEFVPVGDEL